MIDLETLNLQSTIDCENEKIFVDFITKNYDIEHDIDMEKKILHTLRVTKNCRYLGEKLGLNVELCQNIGLLHDFSRFEQKKLYGSFVDYLTKDHADMAVDMLFNDDYIKNFKIDDKDKVIIYYAVKYHNKFFVDKDAIKQEIESKKIFNLLKIEPYQVNIKDVYNYCFVARDGDKIDLLNKIIAGDMNIRYKENGYSPRCLSSINNGELVLIQDIKTKLDRIFCFIGFLFDLNFRQSFELFSLDDFMESLILVYGKILVNEDLEFLRLQIKKSKDDLILKYKLCKNFIFS